MRRVAKALRFMVLNLPNHPQVILRSLNIIKYGKNSLSLKLFYAALACLSTKGRDFDIIHCHFGPNGILGASLREIGAISGRIVTTFHGYDLSSVPATHGANVYAELFRMAELLLPVCERWKHKLIEMGADSDRVIVHRMGVDLQSFRFKHRRLQEGEPTRLLTVGRLVEKKGIEYAIRAVSIVSLEMTTEN